MAIIIDLKAAGKILRLDYETFNTMVWCQVYYIANGEEKRLGGETIERILSRIMVGFMEIKDREWFTYHELEMYTITTLQDSHSVLAGCKDEAGNLQLIFWDTWGNLIPLMKLTTEDKINWINIIFTTVTRRIF